MPLMFSKPLPDDAESLNVLFKASQEALSAVTRMLDRCWLAEQACREFFDGGEIERMAEVFRHLGTEETKAQAAGIPDLSSADLCPFIELTEAPTNASRWRPEGRGRRAG